MEIKNTKGFPRVLLDTEKKKKKKGMEREKKKRREKEEREEALHLEVLAVYVILCDIKWPNSVLRWLRSSPAMLLLQPSAHILVLCVLRGNSCGIPEGMGT